METLGKYELLERLGDGALGSVHKARDASLNRFVALVTLAADAKWDPAAKEIFDAECRSLLSLKHANLAAVYEQGEDRKIIYLVTEFLPGPDLRKLIQDKAPMTVERKLKLMIQAASGIGHAHTKGVLHRNLRPENIHVLPDDRVKVDGFGFTHHPASQGAASRNQAGADLYLSPEQLQGGAAACYSDIFAAGVVLYEFLTGVHPFQESDKEKMLESIRSRTNFPTVEQFADLPMNLWPILERCLAKDAEERYQSMQDFGAACQAVLEELAEDSNWMRIELQTALPRLRRAVRKSGAPSFLRTLQGEIEHALLSEDATDYQSLNRLVLALAEQHNQLEASADAANPFEFETADVKPAAETISPPEESGAKIMATAAPDTSPPLPAAVPMPDENMDGSAESQPSPDYALSGREPIEEQSAGPPPDISLQPPAENRGESTPVPVSNPADVPAAKAGAGQTSADAELPKPILGSVDGLSEMLRNIDQGQESTRKLVDSFLAGRKATGSFQAPDRAGMGAENPIRAARTKTAATSHGGARTRSAPAQPPQYDRRPQPAGAEPSSGADVMEGMAEVPAGFPRRGRRKTALWICVSALVLAMAFAVPWVRDRIGAGLNSTASGDVTEGTRDPVAVVLRNQLATARRDMLLEEAQILYAVGRREESLVFLNRLLELYPDYEPAQKEMGRRKAETAAPETESPQPSAQKLLSSALSAIRAGNLQKASADLDRVEQLYPGMQETASVRKRLEARKAEMAQQLAREQEEQAAAVRAKDMEALARRSDELFRQGKYEEALVIVEGHLNQSSSSPHIRELYSRINELQRDLKVFEAALSVGKLEEAKAALEKIERLNPEDPSLPSLRRRMESVPGTTTLNLFPISEPGSILIDDQQVGTNGELTDHVMPSGRHRLSVKGKDGREVTATQDFDNGTVIAMVYDVAGKVLRGMHETDRSLVSKVKARQQVHRFTVEHSHGLFRGSCKGELVIDFYHVLYQPASGPHGFSVPFKSLILRVENKTATLLFATDKTEFFVFKIADVQTAQQLRKAWDDLTALALAPATARGSQSRSFLPE
jgi:serine/threonine protein kinase